MGERKLGLVAIERACGDRFDLARGSIGSSKKRRLNFRSPTTCNTNLIAKIGRITSPCPRPLSLDGWDSEDLLNPLLDQAEHEAKELGHNYLGSEHLVLAIVKLADPRE